MNLPMLVVALVLLIAIWWFLRQRQAAKSEDAKTTVRPSGTKSAYHAVSIKFPSNACKAAREMQGRRFLSTAAPRLPLPNCDSQECSCRFVHHKDRRAGRDRRSPFAPSGLGGGTGEFAEEQRKVSERRAPDDDDDFF